MSIGQKRLAHDPKILAQAKLGLVLSLVVLAILALGTVFSATPFEPMQRNLFFGLAALFVVRAFGSHALQRTLSREIVVSDSTLQLLEGARVVNEVGWSDVGSVQYSHLLQRLRIVGRKGSVTVEKQIEQYDWLLAAVLAKTGLAPKPVLF